MGVGGELKVQAVAEQFAELDAQQPPLGQHAAVLLDHVAEVRLQRVAHDHQRLAEERALLGAADVERVRRARQEGQIHVAGLAGHGVAQARAVHVEVELPLVADRAHLQQLRAGVHRAQLRGLGQVHHLRHDHVLVGAVGEVQAAVLVHLRGGDLAVHFGQGDHLVAGGLHRACLMDGDVARLRRNHALIAAQRRRQEGKVGLGAAHQQVHVRLRGRAGPLNHRPRLRAELVLAVADGLRKVGVQHLLQDARMRALLIVAVETYHCNHLFYVFSSSVISSSSARLSP